MAVSTEAVKQKIVQRAQGATAAAPLAPKKDALAEFVDSLMPGIQSALPTIVRPDRWARIVLTVLRQSPELLKADRTSLKAAIMLAAQLGLEPGPLQHVYFVTFFNKHSGKTEVQLIVGYRGMLELSRRSGQVVSVMVEPVREGDHFEFELGLHPKLVHRPNLDKRGDPYAYYGIVWLKDGGYQLAVLTRQEIEEHRRRSKSPDKGPWVTDWDMMARKTVIRAMWRWLPQSVEMALAEAVDEAVVHEATSPHMINVTPGYALDDDQMETVTIDVEAVQGQAGGDAAEETPQKGGEATKAQDPGELPF